MNDLTQHQRDILIAMLQGKRIEFLHEGRGWILADAQDVWDWLPDSDHLRIAPNQDEAVRLYGDPNNRHHFNCVIFSPVETGLDKGYIDISPNGFIVGGKIEEVK